MKKSSHCSVFRHFKLKNDAINHRIRNTILIERRVVCFRNCRNRKIHVKSNVCDAYDLCAVYRRDFSAVKPCD